ncbi:septum formation family protein [Nocardioides jensenii]|uniref:septum formation family protein n=1 Tax=Nocardioides jensenii TaxID=1843 RepID=UPI00082E3D81|nr:septum formation family protein [Nocardioides jensenii]
MTRSLIALLLALGLLAGCSDDGDKSAAPEPTPSQSTGAPEPAKPAPRPKPGGCYALSYEAAVAPTNDVKPVSCQAKHTALTFLVGDLNTVVDGHLLTVDSDRVQQQVARSCPQALSDFVGGSAEDLRLSMLSAVWFSPTVEQSDAGQDWYRCEVIAIAAPQRLQLLSGAMKGVLATEEGRDTYGMCGTAKPGNKDFRRVSCARPHTWRAVGTVDVRPGKGGAYPGVEAAQKAGQSICEDTVRDLAEDPLTFTWGYEWPERKQWAAGQHYGFCWRPEA